MRTSIPVPGHPTNPGYSHLIATDHLLFASGQVAEDSEGNLIGKGDAPAQVAQVLANLRTVLAAGGATFDDVVKLNVYVTTRDARAAVVKARLDAFTDPRPACTYIEVAGLAMPEFLVEIEAIAERPQPSASTTGRQD